jgi:hypothetical protein
MSYDDAVSITMDVFNMVQEGGAFKHPRSDVSIQIWNACKEIRSSPSFDYPNSKIKVNSIIIESIASELFEGQDPCWSNILAYFVICIECAHVNKRKNRDGFHIGQLFGMNLDDHVHEWVYRQKGGWAKGFTELMNNEFLKDHNIALASIRLRSFYETIFPLIPEYWYGEEEPDRDVGDE